MNVTNVNFLYDPFLRVLSSQNVIVLLCKVNSKYIACDTRTAFFTLVQSNLNQSVYFHKKSYSIYRWAVMKHV